MHQNLHLNEDVVYVLQSAELALTLVNVVNGPSETEEPSEQVRILDTSVGKGVFAVRPYPATAIIGQITGRRIDDPNHGGEYTFELENGVQLEPDSPFRFVNHSCDPNCEFDLLDEPSGHANANSLDSEHEQGNTSTRNLYLIALKNIMPGQELTIDYNWAADSAIVCKCGSANCRGWVVTQSEVDQVGETLVFDSELEQEQELFKKPEMM